MRHGSALATLTTPIAYVKTYYPDPFATIKDATLCYWASGDRDTTGPGYILWSSGPDKIYDITIDNVSRLYNPPAPFSSPALIELAWDPSNGTVSRGDIYKFKE